SLLVNPAEPQEGYIRHAGLTTDPAASFPGMSRRAWHLASVRTDGSGIGAWSLRWRDETTNHAYAPAPSPDAFFAAFLPSPTLTDASGFGGIRRYARGSIPWSSAAGITD